FGIANQLLASIALVIGTVLILRSGKGRYAWITLGPLAFVATTTVTAAYQSVRYNFLPMAEQGKPVMAYLNSGLTAVMVVALFGTMCIAAKGARKGLLVTMEPRTQPR